MDCDCLFCTLTEDQKNAVPDAAKRLESKFVSDGFTPENARIGAYAEAVFGVYFDIPCNFTRGGDKGRDFYLSSTYRFDVKGTRHSDPQPLRLPPLPKVNYVFIQVKRPHAYFQGFALGKDRKIPWEQRAWTETDGYGYKGYNPPRLRGLEELKDEVARGRTEAAQEKKLFASLLG
jgi:hypothetical protein